MNILVNILVNIYMYYHPRIKHDTLQYIYIYLNISSHTINTYNSTHIYTSPYINFFNCATKSSLSWSMWPHNNCSKSQYEPCLWVGWSVGCPMGWHWNILDTGVVIGSPAAMVWMEWYLLLSWFNASITNSNCVSIYLHVKTYMIYICIVVWMYIYV